MSGANLVQDKKQGWALHSFPFFSLQYVTFFSVLKKERSVLFRSFLEFLATYETQKNAKNAPFFLKERKKTQRTFHSFF